MSPNTPTLETRVASFKLIAREALRMKLISPRLTRIAGLEGEVARANEQKNDNAHEIKVEEYEISKLDVEHPNYAKKLAKKEETLKGLTERVKCFDENLAELDKEINHQKEAISKIESGETKVCLDELNYLVEEMIKKDALNQVPTV